MKIGLENKHSHFFITLRSDSFCIFLVLQNNMYLDRLNGFENQKPEIKGFNEEYSAFYCT